MRTTLYLHFAKYCKSSVQIGRRISVAVTASVVRSLGAPLCEILQAQNGDNEKHSTSFMYEFKYHVQCEHNGAKGARGAQRHV